MSLLYFAGACLAVFAVLQLAVIPRMRRRLHKDRTAAMLPRAAQLAVACYLRTLALVASRTTLGAGGAVELLSRSGSPAVTERSIRTAMETQEAWKRALDAVHSFWFSVTTALLAVGLGIWAYRRRRLQYEKAFDAVRQAEVRRLVESMNTDSTWWELPPTPLMNQVLARILEIERIAPGLPEHVRPAAAQEVEALKNYYIGLDIERRMDVRLDPKDIDDPEPETWRDRLSGLFGSRMVFGSVGLGSRLLYRLNLVLVVLGLISFEASGAIRARREDRRPERPGRPAAEAQGARRRAAGRRGGGRPRGGSRGVPASLSDGPAPVRPAGQRPGAIGGRCPVRRQGKDCPGGDRCRAAGTGRGAGFDKGARPTHRGLARGDPPRHRRPPRSQRPEVWRWPQRAPRRPPPVAGTVAPPIPPSVASSSPIGRAGSAARPSSLAKSPAASRGVLMRPRANSTGSTPTRA